MDARNLRKNVAGSRHFSVLFIIISISIYLLYSVYTDVNQQTIEELKSEQLVHAVQSARGLQVFFQNYENILAYLVKDESIINMDAESHALLSHLYSSHSNEIKAITRIDAGGTIIYTSTADKSIIGRNISYQSHIKQLFKEQKPVLSDVFNAVQGYRAVAFYYPIFKNGIFDGGLAVLIPFDKLTAKFVTDVRVRENGFAWVLSDSGSVLFYPGNKYTDKPFISLLPEKAKYNSVMNSISKGEKGFFESALPDLHSESSDMYSVFFKIRVTDKSWAVVVSVPESEVFSKMRGFVLKWLLVFALLLGLTIYYIYYTAKARAIIKEEYRRKKAEKALISSERKFRSLVDVIPDGIFVIDGDGAILTCNPKAFELLGIVNNDRTFFGRNLKDLLHNSDDSGIGDISQLSISKNNNLNKEFIFHNLKGKVFPVEISIARIPVKDGREDNYTAVIRDITERKQNEQVIIQAREKAERSDRLKSEFLAQMSHEIRSPINSILSFTSLIKDELVDKISEDLKISFSIIDNAGKRIIRTIGLILNMSEIQTGTFEVFKRKIDLTREVLEKVALEYRQPASEKGLDLCFVNNTGRDKIEIFADEYTVTQIFTNLVDNAIKYTPQGSITISLVSPEPGTLVTEIRDTGIGISPEYLPILFTPFSQEEQGYTRRFEGNGLGLALVKRYCEVNGLTIEVDSIKGEGSVFRVIFDQMTTSI